MEALLLDKLYTSSMLVGLSEPPMPVPKTTLVASLTAFVLLALAPGERSLAVASERSAASAPV